MGRKHYPFHFFPEDKIHLSQDSLLYNSNYKKPVLSTQPAKSLKVLEEEKIYFVLPSSDLSSEQRIGLSKNIEAATENVKDYPSSDSVFELLNNAIKD